VGWWKKIDAPHCWAGANHTRIPPAHATPPRTLPGSGARAAAAGPATAGGSWRTRRRPGALSAHLRRWSPWVRRSCWAPGAPGPGPGHWPILARGQGQSRPWLPPRGCTHHSLPLAAVFLTGGGGTTRPDPGNNASPPPPSLPGVLIGAGSFGRVYTGRWAGRDVAVKVRTHGCAGERDGRLPPPASLRAIGLLLSALLQPPACCRVHLLDGSRLPRRQPRVGPPWPAAVATACACAPAARPPPAVCRYKTPDHDAPCHPGPRPPPAAGHDARRRRGRGCGTGNQPCHVLPPPQHHPGEWVCIYVCICMYIDVYICISGCTHTAPSSIFKKGRARAPQTRWAAPLSYGSTGRGKLRPAPSAAGRNGRARRRRARPQPAVTFAPPWC
jgi:hypothetical protein